MKSIKSIKHTVNYQTFGLGLSFGLVTYGLSLGIGLGTL